MNIGTNTGIVKPEATGWLFGHILSIKTLAAVMVALVAACKHMFIHKNTILADVCISSLMSH